MWVEIASVASLSLNDRKEKTGSMNRTPTLGKIRKDIDSHFHGNDREGRGNDSKDKKAEKMCSAGDDPLFHRYIIEVMVEL